MWINWVVLVVSLGLVSGCTKGLNNKTPEGALESYIGAAFSVKGIEDKQKLLNLSAGEAKEQLEAMSDEKFQASFGKDTIKLVSLSMKDRRSEKDGGVSLVYELTYKQGSGDTGPVTHKKIAYLIKQDEESGWRVRGTKNIKEYVEQSEPMVIQLTK